MEPPERPTSHYLGKDDITDGNSDMNEIFPETCPNTSPADRTKRLTNKLKTSKLFCCLKGTIDSERK